MRYADKIPYVFILEYLVDVDVVIKPMFGCHGVYVGGKLCLFLMHRDKPLIRRKDRKDQKGIYVATSEEHVDGLQKIFAEAEFELLKAKKVWIFFSEESEMFEAYAVRACEMISACDPRIGR